MKISFRVKVGAGLLVTDLRIHQQIFMPRGWWLHCRKALKAWKEAQRRWLSEVAPSDWEGSASRCSEGAQGWLVAERQSRPLSQGPMLFRTVYHCGKRGGSLGQSSLEHYSATTIARSLKEDPSDASASVSLYCSRQKFVLKISLVWDKANCFSHLFLNFSMPNALLIIFSCVESFWLSPGLDLRL